MYSAVITSFPQGDDPTVQFVQATLTDDVSGNTIIRNYSLPTADNPQPTDYQNLIQADLDTLNQIESQASTLAQQFLQADLAIPLSDDLQQTLQAIPPGNPADPDPAQT